MFISENTSKVVHWRKTDWTYVWVLTHCKHLRLKQRNQLSVIMFSNLFLEGLFVNFWNLFVYSCVSHLKTKITHLLLFKFNSSLSEQNGHWTLTEVNTETQSTSLVVFPLKQVTGSPLSGLHPLYHQHTMQSEETVLSKLLIKRSANVCLGTANAKMQASHL